MYVVLFISYPWSTAVEANQAERTSVTYDKLLQSPSLPSVSDGANGTETNKTARDVRGGLHDEALARVGTTAAARPRSCPEIDYEYCARHEIAPQKFSFTKVWLPEKHQARWPWSEQSGPHLLGKLRKRIKPLRHKGEYLQRHTRQNAKEAGSNQVSEV